VKGSKVSEISLDKTRKVELVAGHIDDKGEFHAYEKAEPRLNNNGTISFFSSDLSLKEYEAKVKENATQFQKIWTSIYDKKMTEYTQNRFTNAEEASRKYADFNTWKKLPWNPRVLRQMPILTVEVDLGAIEKRVKEVEEEALKLYGGYPSQPVTVSMVPGEKRSGIHSGLKISWRRK
jgi:hypothetical protein